MARVLKPKHSTHLIAHADDATTHESESQTRRTDSHSACMDDIVHTVSSNLVLNMYRYVFHTGFHTPYRSTCRSIYTCTKVLLPKDDTLIQLSLSCQLYRDWNWYPFNTISTIKANLRFRRFLLERVMWLDRYKWRHFKYHNRSSYIHVSALKKKLSHWNFL